jgi:hypothetical protein
MRRQEVPLPAERPVASQERLFLYRQYRWIVIENDGRK